MIVKTRPQAKADGDKFYYTGKPCPKGHNGLRYTSNGTCKDCLDQQVAGRVKSGYFKDQYKKTKKAVLDRCRKRYEGNRQAIIERVAAYYDEHPHIAREAKFKLKSKQRGFDMSNCDSKAIQAWIRDCDKVCVWCKSECKDSYHIDHIYPLAHGGKHELSNLVISCPSCNIKKRNKHPMEWINEVTSTKAVASNSES